MKWLFPAVCIGVVLALAVSFPHAQDAVPDRASDTFDAADNANPPVSDDAAANDRGSGPRINGKAATSDASPKRATGDVPKRANKTGPRADDLAKDASKTAEPSDELKIFRLQRASAESALRTVQGLYSEILARANHAITADTRTNSLLVRGPREFLETVEAVLINLDEFESTPRDDRRAREGDRQENTLQEKARPHDPRIDEYRQYDNHAMRLAAQYRNQKKQSPTDNEKFERLKTQVQDAVRAAFDARQRRELAETDRLRKRLAQIESVIEARRQRAREIIDNRVEELLHPENQWNAGEESTDRAAIGRQPDEAGAPYAGDGDPTRIPLGVRSAISTARVELAEAEKALALARDQANFTARLEKKGYTQAAQREAAQADLAAKQIRRDQAQADLAHAEREAALWQEGEQRVPERGSAPSRSDRAGGSMPRDGSTNYRKALLDAEAAIAVARSTVAQADRALRQSRQQAEEFRKAYATGALPKKTLFDFERDLAAEEGRREQALVELEQAERQAALAREDLAAQIDLLKIELETAGVIFDQASRDDARARKLAEKNAISREESDQVSGALEKARLQLQRAKTLYDLYRKALPQSGSQGSKTPGDGHPKDRGVPNDPNDGRKE